MLTFVHVHTNVYISEWYTYTCIRACISARFNTAYTSQDKNIGPALRTTAAWLTCRANVHVYRMHTCIITSLTFSLVVALSFRSDQVETVTLE